MKRLLSSVLVLSGSLATSLWADFSLSHTVLHPQYPVTGPFIIEITGTWPTDCHPGEQKPVLEAFDGRTVEIGFEMIVQHITCNDTDTAYRVLVDMSQAVKTTRPAGDELEVVTRFGGDSLEQTLDLVCPDQGGCQTVGENRQRPEQGLYHAAGLANQGLLLVRQESATAIYPLVYDKSGNSRWLFSGQHMVENTFFTDLLNFSGGSCYGCEPGGETPEMETIGYLSVLADQPGLLQVKLNDGMFATYSAVVFGYETYPVGPAGANTLVDLQGRWGISENRGTDPPLGDLTAFLPGAFDIVLDEYVTPNGQPSGGQALYTVANPDGGSLGQLLCKGEVATGSGLNVCEFIDPTDAAEPLFRFYQEGPSSMAIEYGRPVIAVGQPPGGKAVRLD
jgi:hypothetical protein